jgi:glycogen(starch) synthase
MRVLMLGWEFPPFISGGLGTACYGLTKAMAAGGTEVLFVLPKAVDRSHASHVTLLSPKPRQTADVTGQEAEGHAATLHATTEESHSEIRNPKLVLRSEALLRRAGSEIRTEVNPGAIKIAPSWVAGPYARPIDQASVAEAIERERISHLASTDIRPGTRGLAGMPTTGGAAYSAAQNAPAASDRDHDLRAEDATDYDGDIISQTQRYADLAMMLSANQSFDVIHAHDWLTYPAGMRIAAATGKPLIVQVHSTEFDRAGENIDQRIYDIERRGMHAATRVICVSHLTRKICEHRYGLDHAKAHVVYNGIDTAGAAIPEPGVGITRRDKIVLFLGRLTFQKGPEYFVTAAKKVLQKVDNVKFIIAGHGDMTQKTVELAASMGIGHRVLFSGFLRGKDVDRMFQMADVYVMPSISEPFGIAPLEAIRHDVPVIISKNSGVAEVLRHALKVDFWDIDEMANKIIAVLTHPPLSRTLREQADFEVRGLTWEGAADKCIGVYDKAIKDMTEPAEPVTAVKADEDFSI